MARPAVAFVCQSCGAAFPKWAGRCEACGSWNSLVEEAGAATAPTAAGRAIPRSGGRPRLAFVPLTGESAMPPRRLTGMGELDRVVGGGFVAGSAILIGGDPGIGKSTLLLQAVALLARNGATAAYVSGEEAIDQVRLRAARLQVADAPVDLAAATALSEILPALDRPPGSPDARDVVVIDSIQTMHSDALESAPGTVAQVRACCAELIRVAKKRGFTLLIVGHVTKEGTIAGPRVLEHMVDTVLYFEGERGHQFRILRAVKNRFGPTDEIGVFEMTGTGLAEVPNPSALFLAERHGDVSGAAVFAGMEGTRPVLVEIQALVAPTSFGTPRRAVVGWDTARLAMVIAVLDARCGLSLGAHDVYLNVAGGLKVGEPAADLAVAAALVSALSGQPVPHDMVVFGEIGLAGEIRQVGQTEARLKEAVRLGFAQAMMPARRAAEKRGGGEAGIRTSELDRLAELVLRFDDGSGAIAAPSRARTGD